MSRKRSTSASGSSSVPFGSSTPVAQLDVAAPARAPGRARSDAHLDGGLLRVLDGLDDDLRLQHVGHDVHRGRQRAPDLVGHRRAVGEARQRDALVVQRLRDAAMEAAGRQRGGRRDGQRGERVAARGRRDSVGHGSLHGRHTTMLTRRPGTTTTFFAGLPSIHRTASAEASASDSIAALSAPTRYLHHDAARLAGFAATPMDLVPHQRTVVEQQAQPASSNCSPPAHGVAGSVHRPCADTGRPEISAAPPAARGEAFAQPPRRPCAGVDGEAVGAFSSFISLPETTGIRCTALPARSRAC